MIADLGKDEISDVFVGNEIIFHMKKKDAKLDEAKVVAALKKHKKVKVGKDAELKEDKEGKYIL